MGRLLRVARKNVVPREDLEHVRIARAFLNDPTGFIDRMNRD